jgi:hypothetical protein
MDQAERDQIQVPRAWLTRVASRICLDTARARVRKAPTRTVPRDEHDRVVRAFAAARKRPGVEALEQDTSDGLGLVFWYEGRIVGVVTLEALAGRITNSARTGGSDRPPRPSPSPCSAARCGCLRMTEALRSRPCRQPLE